MNIVEFALKFKDLASGELGKFGAQTKRIFDNATRQGVNFCCLSSQRYIFLKIENRYKQSKSQRDALMKKKLK